MNWKSLFLSTLMIFALYPSSVSAEGEAEVDTSVTNASSSSEKLMRVRELAEESVRAGGYGRMDDRERSQRQEPSLMKGIQGLGLTLGVFCLLVFILKKVKSRTSGGSTQKVRILERTPLTGKTTLIRVLIDGKESLMAVGSEQVAFLPSELSTGAEHKKMTPSNSDHHFAAQLQQSNVNLPPSIAKAS